MNIKKIALGMATVGTLVPLVVVASCSSSSSSTIDYKISAKTDQVLDWADIEGENYKQLTTLEKLFDGINKDNIEFFTASINSRDSEGEMIYKITLTANEGYSVNGEESISSEFTINSFVLDITPKTKVDNIFITDIEEQNFKEIETLGKLFNNIEQTDLNDSIANIVLNDIDQNKKTITLTAKKGISFDNGLETLSSNEFVLTPIDLDITTKSNPEIHWEDIKDEKYKSLETLGKLFNNVNVDNVNFINISADPIVSEANLTYTITLNANQGYSINTESKLDSKEFKLASPIDLVITPKEEAKKELTQEEVDFLNNQETTDEDLQILSKLFNGLNSNNIRGINITGLLNADNTICGVTLTALDGYTINGKNSSIVVTVSIVN